VFRVHNSVRLLSHLVVTLQWLWAQARRQRDNLTKKGTFVA